MVIPRRAHIATELLRLLARHPKGSQPLTLAQAASILGTGVTTLEFIAAPLVKLGMVIGFRGPSGGYTLAVRPEDICLNVIVKAVSDEEKDGGCLGLILDISLSQYTLRDVISAQRRGTLQIDELRRRVAVQAASDI